MQLVREPISSTLHKSIDIMDRAGSVYTWKLAKIDSVHVVSMWEVGFDGQLFLSTCLCGKNQGKFLKVSYNNVEVGTQLILYGFLKCDENQYG